VGLVSPRRRSSVSALTRRQVGPTLPACLLFTMCVLPFRGALSARRVAAACCTSASGLRLLDEVDHCAVAAALREEERRATAHLL
jgi:hypothetical protein